MTPVKNQVRSVCHQQCAKSRPGEGLTAVGRAPCQEEECWGVPAHREAGSSRSPSVAGARVARVGWGGGRPWVPGQGPSGR